MPKYSDPQEGDPCEWVAALHDHYIGLRSLGCGAQTPGGRCGAWSVSQEHEDKTLLLCSVHVVTALTGWPQAMSGVLPHDRYIARALDLCGLAQSASKVAPSHPEESRSPCGSPYVVVM